jgi:hypothetical protein
MKKVNMSEEIEEKLIYLQYILGSYEETEILEMGTWILDRNIKTEKSEFQLIEMKLKFSKIHKHYNTLEHNHNTDNKNLEVEKRMRSAMLNNQKK